MYVLRYVIGAAVEIIGKPLDLLICHHGETYLAEIKNPDGRNRLTPAQIKFIKRWPGKILTFRSGPDAVNQLLGRKP